MMMKGSLHETTVQISLVCYRQATLISAAYFFIVVHRWVLDEESNTRERLRVEAQSLPFPKENVLHRDYESAVKVTCRSASSFKTGEQQNR